jgi:hypothetical protein
MRQWSEREAVLGRERGQRRDVSVLEIQAAGRKAGSRPGPGELRTPDRDVAYRGPAVGADSRFEIELNNGRRLRVLATFDAAAVKAMVVVLAADVARSNHDRRSTQSRMDGIRRSRSDA